MAHVPTEACWALADKAADLIETFASVEAGRAHTLIHLELTMIPLISRHANAGVLPDTIQTSAVILARV